jgi:hypothetical protein
MKNEKLHLIPQVIIDCAEGLMNTKQENLRINYIIRLEAIRDYCDSAVKNYNMRSNTNIFKRPTKNNIRSEIIK